MESCGEPRGVVVLFSAVNDDDGAAGADSLGCCLGAGEAWLRHVCL